MFVQCFHSANFEDRIESQKQIPTSLEEISKSWEEHFQLKPITNSMLTNF